jgi:hypothetical protein
MKTYLFTEGPITEIEREAEHGGGAADGGDAPAPVSGDGSLGIGSLRQVHK